MTAISYDQAFSLLKPLNDAFLRCVEHGVAQWAAAKPHLAVPDPKTRATFIWNAMVDRARRELGGHPGVRVVDRPERIFFVIQNSLVLRFKKLSHDLRTSNYPTATALAIDLQAKMPGVPANASLITVGYILDRVTDQLLDAHVVHAIGNSLQWQYSLSKPLAPVQQLPLPIAPAAAAPQRVRLRAGAKDETKKKASKK